MKWKITIILLFLSLGISSIFSQGNNTYYYYYKGKKIELTLDKQRVNIVTSKDETASTLNIPSSIPFTITNRSLSEMAFSSVLKEIKLSTIPTDAWYKDFVSNLESSTVIKRVLPCYRTADTRKEISTSEYLYVKLRREPDFNLLEMMLVGRKLIIIDVNKYMPLWYKLQCIKGNVLEAANALFETGKFAAVVPDFLSNDLACSNDPQFDNQWALKNNDNLGIDVSACDAWINATGKGIKVAVVDQGIDMTHNDLKRNIYPLSYDSETGTSPSKLYGNHGTHCAGIIGASRDNNLQIAGIAPDAKLISVSNSLYANAESRMKRADAINWAWMNGADIITNSWGSAVKFEAIDDAIENALTKGRNGKGCIVCFASGNDYGTVAYPAMSNDKILAVGAINNNGTRANFSNYGNTLDVVAPGYNILSTLPNNTIGYMNGTSMACPYVAGIAALLLEKNPDLTVEEANAIIERNTKKVGNYSYHTYSAHENGTWNSEMGYGLVNAFNVVSHAKPYDLVIRDSEEDSGAEPNLITEYLWESPDIWVRNSDDNQLTHENPIYKSTPSYIYVRVKNIGTVTTEASDFVEIRWAKAGIALNWPNSWYEGERFNDYQIPLGGWVGSKLIGALSPGQDTIISIPWTVPDPRIYEGITPEPWHFCLLARAISSKDPIPEATSKDLGIFVRNNNNVAWKNVSIAEVTSSISQTVNGAVFVKNTNEIPKTYTIEVKEKEPIYSITTYSSTNEKPKVSLELSPNLYKAWERGGSAFTSMTANSSKIELTNGNNGVLRNMTLNPQEAGIINVQFNVPSSMILNSSYTYRVILKDENGNIVGGETYLVKRKTFRPIFPPHIEQIPNIENGTVELKASDINEPATYNWYNSNDNLIATGQTLEVFTEKAEKYKLEVIAEKDNYKDYAETIVQPMEGIKSISPNPTMGQVIIKFLLIDPEYPKIKIYELNGNSEVFEYPIDYKENLKVIDMSKFRTGIYSVSIISDNKVIDSKKIIKQ